MGYKIIGWLVWNGVKWYLRGRLPLPTRKAAAIGFVAGSVAVLAITAARRESSG